MTKMVYQWKIYTVSLLFILFDQNVNVSNAFVGNAFNKVQKDFLALTRRVTARHILVSNEEIAVALKRKIRDDCISSASTNKKKDDKEEGYELDSPIPKENETNDWIVTVFEEAATKYSKDGTTKDRGGLLGTLVPQGYCQSRILDQACFEVTLGQLEGPLSSEFGYHLLLVTERTNCPNMDGANTKLIQTRNNDAFGTLVPSKQVGAFQVGDFFVSQIVFIMLIFVAGGIVAELAQVVPLPTAVAASS